MNAGASPSDPVAPLQVSVAAALVSWLKAEGVGHIFGIPGGALISMLQALKAEPDITYHICRQETGAAYIADGYARASGGLGVVLVTSGPGATNALTGLVNADASGTPLLIITGEIKEQSTSAAATSRRVSIPRSTSSTCTRARSASAR